MKDWTEILTIMRDLMVEIDKDHAGLKIIPRIKLEAYAHILEKEEIPTYMINKMYWIGMGNIIETMNKKNREWHMIKTTVVEATKEIRFPKLMSNPLGAIILITSREGVNGTGMMVESDGVYPVGNYATTWDMSKLSDYKGSVTLENKE